MTQRKSLSQDVIEQAIHEVVPPVAKWVVAKLPEGLRSTIGKSAAWRLALPAISVGLARFTPDNPPWDIIDRVRAEFFSEFSEAVSAEPEPETAEAVKPKSQPGQRQRQKPNVPFGLLNLDLEGARKVAAWLQSVYAREGACQGQKALLLLDEMTVKELMCFAGFSSAEKTAYFKSRTIAAAKKKKIKDDKEDLAHRISSCAWKRVAELRSGLDSVNEKILKKKEEIRAEL